MNNWAMWSVNIVGDSGGWALFQWCFSRRIKASLDAAERHSDAK
jgi:hypothetical protein